MTDHGSQHHADRARLGRADCGPPNGYAQPGPFQIGQSFPGQFNLGQSQQGPGDPSYGFGSPPTPPPWVAHRYGGATVAAGGAVVSVFAFLFLPYQIIFGALTAPEVIEYNATENAAWNLVWLTPVITALVGITAFCQFGKLHRRPSSRIRAFDRIRTLAALVIGVYLLNIVVLSASNDYRDFDLSVANLLGLGFWFGLFGMIGAYIGATVEFRNLRRWKAEAWSGWS